MCYLSILNATEVFTVEVSTCKIKNISKGYTKINDKYVFNYVCEIEFKLKGNEKNYKIRIEMNENDKIWTPVSVYENLANYALKKEEFDIEEMDALFKAILAKERVRIFMKLNETKSREYYLCSECGAYSSKKNFIYNMEGDCLLCPLDILERKHRQLLITCSPETLEFALKSNKSL